MSYLLGNLDVLEAESIHIIREVAAEFGKPVMMFSGGKDSICMVHLAIKAFYPAKLPFPLLHVDTGHNFDEVIDYRDRLVERTGAKLIVASVEEAINSGIAAAPTGKNASRNWAQIPTLLKAIEDNKFDAAFGGARRDEEKARAKERVYSFRDDFGTWDPKNQRPELWSLYNGKINPGEHIRAFPISNWTELDVWQYIKREGIEVPSIYFSHEREVFDFDGQLLAKNQFMDMSEYKIENKKVRYRTVGDIVCTGAVTSEASSLEEIIQEIKESKVTERGARADDKVSEAAMEDRKKEGYF